MAYSSEINNCPEDLRVLVVDSDDSELNKLQTILNSFNYQVCKCNSVKEAIKMLVGDERFNIVLSNVNMTDCDGFNFLNVVAHFFDLPVIMMSENGEKDNVIKGIEYGACHFLLKPLVPEDVQYIWTHSIHKRNQIQGDGEGEGDRRPNTQEIDEAVERKRKKVDGSCSNSVKKARLKWTPELKIEFKKAVERTGGLQSTTAVKIHNSMREAYNNMGAPFELKIEHISSHLQSCRNNAPKYNSYSGVYNPLQVDAAATEELNAFLERDFSDVAAPLPIYFNSSSEIEHFLMDND